MVNNDITNLPPADAPASELKRGDFPVLAGRCHPDDLKVVAMAAAIQSRPRGHFVVDAAVARARVVLAEAGIAA